MTFCVEPDRLYFTLRSFPRTYGKVFLMCAAFSFVFTVLDVRTQEANGLIAYVPSHVTLLNQSNNFFSGTGALRVCENKVLY